MKIEELEKLFKQIPRKRLLFLPTPFHKLENLSKKYGMEMYIKRDDLTGPSPYGGNKTRKIEFILGSSLEEDVEYLLSVGGYQTNAGMELTECCRAVGLKPILYLVDTIGQGAPPEQFLANLRLNKIMGCEIHFVGKQAGEDIWGTLNRCVEMCEKRKEELEKEGHKARVIPAGCVAPEGWVSYVLGFKEIIEQSNKMGVALDYIFHTTGTGGSLPGLIAGKLMLESNIKIISININPFHPREEELGVTPKDICDRVEHVFNQLGVNPPSREKIFREINIDYNFTGEDYGVPSTEGTEAIREMAREEGLMLDPVYTGKGFAGFLDYVRSTCEGWVSKSGKIPKGSKVAFLHTGGTGALFAEEKLTGRIWE